MAWDPYVQLVRLGVLVGDTLTSVSVVNTDSGASKITPDVAQPQGTRFPPFMQDLTSEDAHRSLFAIASQTEQVVQALERTRPIRSSYQFVRASCPNANQILAAQHDTMIAPLRKADLARYFRVTDAHGADLVVPDGNGDSQPVVVTDLTSLFTGASLYDQAGDWSSLQVFSSAVNGADGHRWRYGVELSGDPQISATGAATGPVAPGSTTTIEDNVNNPFTADMLYGVVRNETLGECGFVTAVAPDGSSATIAGMSKGGLNKATDTYTVRAAAYVPAGLWCNWDNGGPNVGHYKIVGIDGTLLLLVRADVSLETHPIVLDTSSFVGTIVVYNITTSDPHGAIPNGAVAVQLSQDLPTEGGELGAYLVLEHQVLRRLLDEEHSKEVQAAAEVSSQLILELQELKGHTDHWVNPPNETSDWRLQAKDSIQHINLRLNSLDLQGLYDQIQLITGYEETLVAKPGEGRSLVPEGGAVEITEANPEPRMDALRALFRLKAKNGTGFDLVQTTPVDAGLPSVGVVRVKHDCGTHPGLGSGILTYNAGTDTWTYAMDPLTTDAPTNLFTFEAHGVASLLHIATDVLRMTLYHVVSVSGFNIELRAASDQFPPGVYPDVVLAAIYLPMITVGAPPTTVANQEVGQVTFVDLPENATFPFFRFVWRSLAPLMQVGSAYGFAYESARWIQGTLGLGRREEDSYWSRHDLEVNYARAVSATDSTLTANGDLLCLLDILDSHDTDLTRMERESQLWGYPYRTNSGGDDFFGPVMGSRHGHGMLWLPIASGYKATPSTSTPEMLHHGLLAAQPMWDPQTMVQAFIPDILHRLPIYVAGAPNNNKLYVSGWVANAYKAFALGVGKRHPALWAYLTFTAQPASNGLYRAVVHSGAGNEYISVSREGAAVPSEEALPAGALGTMHFLGASEFTAGPGNVPYSPWGWALSRREIPGAATTYGFLNLQAVTNSSKTDDPAIGDLNNWRALMTIPAEWVVWNATRNCAARVTAIDAVDDWEVEHEAYNSAVGEVVTDDITLVRLNPAATDSPAGQVIHSGAVTLPGQLSYVVMGLNGAPFQGNTNPSTPASGHYYLVDNISWDTLKNTVGSASFDPAAGTMRMFSHYWNWDGVGRVLGASLQHGAGMWYFAFTNTPEENDVATISSGSGSFVERLRQELTGEWRQLEGYTKIVSTLASKMLGPLENGTQNTVQVPAHTRPESVPLPAWRPGHTKHNMGTAVADSLQISKVVYGDVSKFMIIDSSGAGAGTATLSVNEPVGEALSVIVAAQNDWVRVRLQLPTMPPWSMLQEISMRHYGAADNNGTMRTTWRRGGTWLPPNALEGYAYSAGGGPPFQNITHTGELYALDLADATLFPEGAGFVGANNNPAVPGMYTDAGPTAPGGGRMFVRLGASALYSPQSKKYPALVPQIAVDSVLPYQGPNTAGANKTWTGANMVVLFAATLPVWALNAAQNAIAPSIFGVRSHAFARWNANGAVTSLRGSPIGAADILYVMDTLAGTVHAYPILGTAMDAGTGKDGIVVYDPTNTLGSINIGTTYAAVPAFQPEPMYLDMVFTNLDAVHSFVMSMSDLWIRYVPFDEAPACMDKFLTLGSDYVGF